jgi:hypothetical protein
MDYIIKNKLQNKYPSILNYYADDGGYFYLDGVFSKENYIAWKKPNISQLKYIPKTSFRFIVEFVENEDDKYSKFYTSEAYYKDLVNSQKDNNPYFSKSSFKKDLIIKIDLGQLISQRLKLDIDEGNMGIRVSKNLLFDANYITEDNVYGIDYESLGVYIDWLITQEKDYNAVTGGVIPANYLGVWNLGIWNRRLGIYQSEDEYNYYVYKQALLDQLEGIEGVIKALNYLYLNPDSDTAMSNLEIVGKSLLTATEVVGGVAAALIVGNTAILAATATYGIGAALAEAVTLLSVIPVWGWVAAGVVLVLGFIFGGKSAEEEAADRKRDAIRKYCKDELPKYERFKTETLAAIEAANKLTPEGRKPISIVNSDTGKLKQTAFEYDDERFQTKNERRIYSANMRTPVTFGIVPNTGGEFEKIKTPIESDKNTKPPEWATITTN